MAKDKVDRNKKIIHNGVEYTLGDLLDEKERRMKKGIWRKIK